MRLVKKNFWTVVSTILAVLGAGLWNYYSEAGMLDFVGNSLLAGVFGAMVGAFLDLPTKSVYDQSPDEE